MCSQIVVSTRKPNGIVQKWYVAAALKLVPTKNEGSSPVTAGYPSAAMIRTCVPEASAAAPSPICVTVC
eukprot:6204867-Pleurochrysis_carterae.AAC.1